MVGQGRPAQQRRPSARPPSASLGVCAISGMRKREPQVQQTCKARLGKKRVGSGLSACLPPLSNDMQPYYSTTEPRDSREALRLPRLPPSARPTAALSPDLRWALVVCQAVGQIAELRCAGRRAALQGGGAAATLRCCRAACSPCGAPGHLSLNSRHVALVGPAAGIVYCAYLQHAYAAH